MAIGSILHNPKKIIKSITINTEPKETTYMIGESFNPEGLEIIINYYDNSSTSVGLTHTETINNFTTALFFPQNFSSTNLNQTVTIILYKFDYKEPIQFDISGLKIIDKIPTWEESSWDDIYAVCQKYEAGTITSRIWDNYVKLGDSKTLFLNYAADKDLNSPPGEPIPSSCIMEVTKKENAQLTFTAKNILYNMSLQVEGQEIEIPEGQMEAWFFTKLFAACAEFYKAMLINRKYLISQYIALKEDYSESTVVYCTIPVEEGENKFSININTALKNENGVNWIDNYEEQNYYINSLNSDKTVKLNDGTILDLTSDLSKTYYGFVPQFIFGYK